MQVQRRVIVAVGTTALANAASQGGGRVSQGKGTQTAVTLAVKEKFVPFVVHAAEQGSIYLTLMPPNAPPVERGKPVNDSNDIPQELE